SFMRALRRGAPEVATIPALIISTESGQQDIDDSRNAGANFYLVKPVSDVDLIRHVAALTGAPA
ncbi:MAG: response regulator, partial [Xanthobacteraceae bacterium]